MNLGSGYVGSPDLLTSVAYVEVLPNAPTGWTKGYSFYKFSFSNDQSCHVQINGNTGQIYLRAGQGFNVDQNDKAVTSFMVVESGITFNWIGAF